MYVPSDFCQYRDGGDGLYYIECYSKEVDSFGNTSSFPNMKMLNKEVGKLPKEFVADFHVAKQARVFRVMQDGSKNKLSEDDKNKLDGHFRKRGVTKREKDRW